VTSLHLAFNIYWLWILGTIVERVYGHLRTAALIALFALGSSSLEFAFSVGGIGLSGVGYGLFALLWVLSRHDERFRGAVNQKIVRLFIGWFFFCILLTAMHIFPVGNIAHGTGAVLGFLTATATVMPHLRRLITIGIAAVLLFGVWASTLGRPSINLSRTGGTKKRNGLTMPS
jgi:membrane associated rhomboid family serine protease